MPADFLLNDDGDQFLVDGPLVEEALVLEEDGVTELELEEGGGSIEVVVLGPAVDFLLIDGGDYQLGLSSTVSVSDSFSRTTDTHRTPADVVEVSDSFLYGWDTFLPLADTVSLSDALAFAQGQKLADSVALSDARTFDRGMRIADAVLAGDGALVIQWGDGTDHKMLIDTDAVSITDRVRIQHGVPRQFTQTPIEALVEPVAKAQFTQTPIEALVYLESDAQFTQIPVEVLVTPAVINAQFTQIAIEVLRRVQNETYEVVYID